MRDIKKLIVIIIFTTGAAITILAVFYGITGKKDIMVSTILEIFTANILIAIGLLLRFKIEIRNIILEFFVDVSYIIAILAVFGLIFDWYSEISIVLLIFMAVVIYIFAIITVVVKTRKDAEEINELIRKRKEKDKEIAP